MASRPSLTLSPSVPVSRRQPAVISYCRISRFLKQKSNLEHPKTSKISCSHPRSNSNNATATTSAIIVKNNQAEPTKPVTNTTEQKQRILPHKKPNWRRGSISCGKRTNFGHDKDFHQKYRIGKLLDHGQYGYTHVATDKSNGDRVAVKKIDKDKVVV